MNKRLVILVSANNSGVESGGGRRTGQIIRRLREFGWHVDVLEMEPSYNATCPDPHALETASWIVNDTRLWFRELKKWRRKLIYSSHNIESLLRIVIFLRWPSLNNFKKMIRYGTSEWLNAFNSRVIISISQADSRWLALLRPTLFIPPGPDFERIDFLCADGGRVLFVGSHEWEPNRQCISVISKRIFPQLCGLTSQRVSINVIGRGNSRYARRDLGSSSLVFKDYVEDLDGEYSRAGLVIAPVTLGSGTNMKMVDAVEYGLPVVATGKALRGFGSIAVSIKPVPLRQFAREIDMLISSASCRADAVLRVLCVRDVLSRAETNAWRWFSNALERRDVSTGGSIEIYLYPGRVDSNEYISNVNRVLTGGGCIVSSFSRIYRAFLPVRGNMPRVVWLNWLESAPFDKATGKLRIRGILRFFSVIVAAKLARARLVWVAHNVTPHNISGRRKTIARRLMSLLERLSDVRVSHCPVLSEGYSYLPHPLYFPAAEVGKLAKKEFSNSEDTDTLFIFGAISRYKQLEDVIRMLPAGRRLVIAGQQIEHKYVAELRELALIHNKQLEMRPGWLSSGDLRQLLAEFRIVVIPHGSRSSAIVSGAFYHALTFGNIVIARNTPHNDYYAADLINVLSYHDSGSLRAAIDEARALARRLDRTTAVSEAEARFGEETCVDYFTRLAVSASSADREYGLGGCGLQAGMASLRGRL